MVADRSLGHESQTGSRKTLIRFCSFALAVAALGCSVQFNNEINSKGFAADVAAIRAVFDTTAAGWNRGELPVYLSAYNQTSTTMGSNGLVRGVAGIEGQMRSGFWKDGRPAQVLRYEHLEVRALGRDNALATGQYILSGGGRPDRSGWFTTIWQRTPQGWRMIHDHS
jgi:ketosteroid isomerase-like protein